MQAVPTGVGEQTISQVVFTDPPQFDFQHPPQQPPPMRPQVMRDDNS